MLSAKREASGNSSSSEDEYSIDDIVSSISENSISKEKFIVVKVIELLETTISVTHVDGVRAYSAVYSTRNTIIGYVISSNKYDISVALLTDATVIPLGKELYISEEPISVKIDTSIRKVAIDPLGNVLISVNKHIEDSVGNHSTLPIFQEPIPLSKRVRLDEQIITGSNIIDTIYNIVYGCRMLIVGNKMVYKTGLIRRIIMNMSYNAQVFNECSNDVFIYVSIGQRAKEVVTILDELGRNNVDNFIIVSATASTTIGMRLLAPYSAMSIATKIAEQYSKNVVVFIDDLTSHAISIREMYSVLKYSPGRESYPSNIFNLHASLLERAGKFSRFGTSVTCIPVIKVIEDDLAGYIATNSISITDGQIYLREVMFKDNIIPPVDSGLSVSRIGSNYQYLIYKNISLFCRRTMNEFNSTINFYKTYKQDCEISILRKIRSGMLVRIALYNTATLTTTISYQIACIMMIYVLREDKHDLIMVQVTSDDEYTRIILNYIEYINQHIRHNQQLLVDAIKLNSKEHIEKLIVAAQEAISMQDCKKH